MLATLPMAPAVLALALVMTFGAAAIRGLTGFGMAIILVPLLSLIIAPLQAVVIGILLQLYIGPVGWQRIIHDSERASAIPIAIIAVVVTPLGLILLSAIAPDVARLLISSIAIAAFVAVVLPSGPPRAASRTSIALTGITAGVLTGFAAMPGPPVVPFYLRRRLPPPVARASMMLVFFATAIAGSVSALTMGRIDGGSFILSLWLFPAVLLGNWAGGLGFGKMPEKIWRALVALILGVAGAAALWRLLH